MSTTTQLPASSCPHCNYQMDACTAIAEGDVRPSEGDLSICASCGTFLQFNAELLLELLPDEAILDLEDEQRLQLTRARKMITERGPLHRAS